MGIGDWVTVVAMLAFVAFVIWVVWRQDSMFPRGTRVGKLDEREDRERTPRWTAFWHRGGSGGL